MASLSSILLEPSPDHEVVIKACNAALKQSKSDTSAQHAKIIALLHLDRFDDTARVFADYGEGLQKKASLEYAYTLYKTGELEDAQEATKGVNSKGAMHLEAQASYRLEDFANAARIYKELWSSKGSREESDLRINSGATDAQLQWARQGDLVFKKKPGREDLEAFETAYNAACGCLARGELGQGEVLLKRAKDLCELSELSEDEKKDELLPISVQQLYVFTALGKTEQAEVVASEITLKDIPDASTRAIAQINQLAASKSANPYLSQRILSSAVALPKNDHFFHFQETLAKQNELALDLAASKFNGVEKSTRRLLSENPSPTTLAMVNGASSANAAAHAQGQLGKLGLKSILPLLESRPKDVGLVATIIQLYSLTKNYGAAITVLESFLKRLDHNTTDSDQEVRFSSGLVAILVSLYSIEGRKSQTRTELARAASYWRHKSRCPPGLLRAAGLSLLESDDILDLDKAGQIFETLRQQNPTDRTAAAGYVASYAPSKPNKVSADADKLTAINRLTAGIDVDALERAGVPQAAVTASSVASKKRAGGENAKPAKKRVRKSRLPKDMDPNKKPDPERWLPLRDRSTYKPKGKKGKQKQQAMTQGGISEKAVEEKESAKTVVVGAGGGGKGKKKKGKK